MHIELGEILILGGEFRTISATDGIGIPVIGKSGSLPDLNLQVTYALMSVRKEVLGRGVATNSIDASSLGIKLSDETLVAFTDFYHSLRDDIQNGLENETKEKPAPDQNLAELMGG